MERLVRSWAREKEVFPLGAGTSSAVPAASAARKPSNAPLGMRMRTSGVRSIQRSVRRWRASREAARSARRSAASTIHWLEWGRPRLSANADQSARATAMPSERRGTNTLNEAWSDCDAALYSFRPSLPVRSASFTLHSSEVLRKVAPLAATSGRLSVSAMSATTRLTSSSSRASPKPPVGLASTTTWSPCFVRDTKRCARSQHTFWYMVTTSWVHELPSSSTPVRLARLLTRCSCSFSQLRVPLSPGRFFSAPDAIAALTESSVTLISGTRK
mmetsp:Transcript_21987/g.83661  ORF Transcript_21987/g.83661 Transcript_21987/m.83661 type:complete len:273 (+) Transcript_21987:197-1015(+)